MRKVIAGMLAATMLAGCATGATGAASEQAKFDQACKYANGVLSAAQPIIPLIQGLILARFGQDASTGFQAAIQVVETTCSAPLNLADSAALIQRVYDAGGQIVALVVKSQAAP